MKAPLRFLLAAAALAATASAAEAADPEGTGKPEAPAKAAGGPEAPAAQPAPPPRPRIVSKELAATLATGLPKFNPPKAEEAKPPAEEPPADDADDADKPKNGIVRLPAVVVGAARPPIFRERDLYSEKGRTSLAMKRYAGLDIPLIGFLNRPIALQMYNEDQRLQDMADLQQDAANARRAGAADDSEYIRRTGAEVFARRSDFGVPVDGRASSGADFGLGDRK